MESTNMVKAFACAAAVGLVGLAGGDAGLDGASGAAFAGGWMAVALAALLKGVSPVLNGDMLKVLCDMGHGDEIVIADANFPAHTFGQRVIRADGVPAAKLLAGLRPFFELDSYATPVVMMDAVKGDTLDPRVERDYRTALGYEGAVERISREAFYKRSAQAFAVIVSGETAKYGNIILKKGVISVGNPLEGNGANMV